MRQKLAILSLVTGAVLLSPASHEDAALTRCMEKARVYYQSIGQYPMLAVGIDAAFVAREHCSRSSSAFDEISVERTRW